MEELDVLRNRVRWILRLAAEVKYLCAATAPASARNRAMVELLAESAALLADNGFTVAPSSGLSLELGAVKPKDPPATAPPR